MADGLNRVQLLGNLGADPELKMTAGGQAILKMRLATTESYLDREKVRQERTEWHSVTLWGKRAEGLSKFLSKGMRIFVEGGLRTSSYEKDGEKRYKTEVNATNVILCGDRGGKRETSDDDRDEDRIHDQKKANGYVTEKYDDAPNWGAASSGGSRAGGGDDDDIPFAPLGDVG